MYISGVWRAVSTAAQPAAAVCSEEKLNKLKWASFAFWLIHITINTAEREREGEKKEENSNRARTDTSQRHAAPLPRNSRAKYIYSAVTEQQKRTTQASCSKARSCSCIDVTRIDGRKSNIYHIQRGPKMTTTNDNDNDGDDSFPVIYSVYYIYFLEVYRV